VIPGSPICRVLIASVLILLFSERSLRAQCNASDLLMKAADSEEYLRWFVPGMIPLGPDGTFGTDETKALNDAKTAWKDANAKIGFIGASNATFKSLPGGVPAQTLVQPLEGTAFLAGATATIEINDDMVWTLFCPTNDWDLPSALVHEVGHLVGLLDHACSSTESVLWGFLPKETCAVTPLSADKDALKILYPDNPAAETSGFVVVDGVARWFMESTFRTAAMVVEGSYGKDGPWREVYRTEPRVGQNRAAVGTSGFAFFRLMEEEVTGRRLSHGFAGTTPTMPGGTASQRVASSEADQAPQARSPRARVLPWPTSPGNSMSIYTPGALSATVTARIANHWVANGYQVTVNQTDGFPVDPDGFRSTLKAAIAAEAADGTQYFLLAGDANDYVEFSTPWPGEWETIRQDRIAAGYPPGGQPERDLIPTFVVPDTVSRDLSMSWFSPYWFSDLPYADTDDDGIPDVVVGRLPVASSAEVERYGAKLAAGLPWNSDRVGFLVGDRNTANNGDDQRATDTAQELLQGIPPWT